MFDTVDTGIKKRGYVIGKNLSNDYFGRVYLAEKDSEEYVVKYPNPKKVYAVNRHKNRKDLISLQNKINHVQNENAVYNLISDIKGVARRTDSFDLPFFWSFVSSHPLNVFQICRQVGYGYEVPIIVKEYIEGEMVSDANKIVGSDNQIFISKVVEELHYRGIVKLELNCKNSVIISQTDGKPYLFDFGNAKIINKGAWFYKIHRHNDLKYLEELFG